uniref:C-type lectin domain-containing protein n=1 Tax=Pygocentrus nattereri TaxID=42514 RepID=A0AAR2JVV3_PYGNA
QTAVPLLPRPVLGGVIPLYSPCPSNYVTWYKNCYRLVSEPKTWEEAEAACVKEGGHLASVDMSYDQAFISGAIQQGNTDAWIGLSVPSCLHRYGWSDGWPVFYTHWGPGEPTNHKGEGCVSMHGRSHFIQGTWNDTACESIVQLLCLMCPSPFLSEVLLDQLHVLSDPQC